MESKTTTWGVEESYKKWLVEAVDSIVGMEPERRKRLTNEYAIMIIEPLRQSGIKVETLEHLKIEFVDFDKRLIPSEIKVEEETELGTVQKAVKDQFGFEMLCRLNLSLSKRKVNIFTGE